MVTNHAPQMKNSRNIIEDSFTRVVALIVRWPWGDAELMGSHLSHASGPRGSGGGPDSANPSLVVCSAPGRGIG